FQVIIVTTRAVTPFAWSVGVTVRSALQATSKLEHFWSSTVLRHRGLVAMMSWRHFRIAASRPANLSPPGEAAWLQAPRIVKAASAAAGLIKSGTPMGVERGTQGPDATGLCGAVFSPKPRHRAAHDRRRP